MEQTETITGYRKINLFEHLQFISGNFASNLSMDYRTGNIYKLQNNIDYMYFFPNCNMCLNHINDISKKYIVKCQIPLELVEHGKAYYKTLLLPEFRVLRESFRKEFIEQIVRESDVPSSWLNDEEYNMIKEKSETYFDRFPFLEEEAWAKSMHLDKLDMLLPNERIIMPYGRLSLEYLARGMYNYGVENVKDLFAPDQPELLKIDVLRAISDLVAFCDDGFNVEFDIFNNEGLEFAQMLIYCAQHQTENYSLLKYCKVHGIDNSEIKRVLK